MAISGHRYSGTVVATDNTGIGDVPIPLTLIGEIMIIYAYTITLACLYLAVRS